MAFQFSNQKANVLWDIENQPIPKKEDPKEYVRKIKGYLAAKYGIKDGTFTAYCCSSTDVLKKKVQNALQQYGWMVAEIPKVKAGGEEVDKRIIADIGIYGGECAYKGTKGSIIVISKDNDYSYILSTLSAKPWIKLAVMTTLDYDDGTFVSKPGSNHNPSNPASNHNPSNPASNHNPSN
eukprot:276733_1